MGEKIKYVAIIGAIILLISQIETNAYAINKITMPIFLNYEQDKQGLIDIYNQFNNDFIVGFTELRTYDYIKKINGEKVITYFNASKIIEEIDKLKANNIKWVAYDLEKGYSPSNEINDPINTVKNLYSKLKANNMNLILTIANIDNVLNVIKASVKYADMFILQTQYLQQYGSDTYAKQTKELIKIIKQSNPNIKVITQVSLIKGDLQNCKDSFSKVADYADGVTLFFKPNKDELNKVKEFYKWLESNY